MIAKKIRLCISISKKGIFFLYLDTFTAAENKTGKLFFILSFMRCQTGKNSYSTKVLAETALIDIHIHRNFTPDQGPQNVYQCEFCGAWHFTSKSPERNERLQEMIDSGEMRRLQLARQWE